MFATWSRLLIRGKCLSVGLLRAIVLLPAVLARLSRQPRSPFPWRLRCRRPAPTPLARIFGRHCSSHPNLLAGFCWSFASAIDCHSICHATSSHLIAGKVGRMGLILPMMLWDATPRWWLLPQAVYAYLPCASSSSDLSAPYGSRRCRASQVLKSILCSPVWVFRSSCSLFVWLATGGWC
jgi:hypothetical protein